MSEPNIQPAEDAGATKAANTVPPVTIPDHRKEFVFPPNGQYDSPQVALVDVLDEADAISEAMESATGGGESITLATISRIVRERLKSAHNVETTGSAASAFYARIRDEADALRADFFPLRNSPDGFPASPPPN